MDWPGSLIEELAYRRVVLFLGSGVSATAKLEDGTSLPDWPGLLESLSSLLPPDHQKLALEMVSQGSYLDAAQVITDYVDFADFSKYMTSVFMTPKYRHSVVHECINDIDPKIVVTTNYDQIYEKYCDKVGESHSHNVCRHTDGFALDSIRSNVRIILKAHGCISDVRNIVLSRASYFEARRKNPEFYSILNAVLLVNTVLFLGCGLSDPDIQLALETINLSAPSQHSHFALVPKGRHPSISAAIKKTYNIKLIEYDGSVDHVEMLDLLLTLKQRVAEFRASEGLP